MSQFEKFVTEGIEKADDLAKVGAMLDEGLMAAQAQAEGQVGFRGKEEREYHRTEWCAEAKEVSVFEMWKRKQIHKMPGTKILDKKLGKMVKTTVGRP